MGSPWKVVASSLLPVGELLYYHRVPAVHYLSHNALHQVLCTHTEMPGSSKLLNAASKVPF